MRMIRLSVGLLVLTAAPAEAREKFRLDYVLPSVTITAGVTQRITKCPVPAEAQAALKDGDPGLGVDFAYGALIVGKRKPLRLVSLDAESGFLVDRDTKAHFQDDWYLKDFNSKSTGQGGPLLVSLIKAGAAIHAMGANPILGIGRAPTPLQTHSIAGDGPRRPPPKRYYATRHYLECQPEIVRKLDQLEAKRRDIAELEALIVGGKATPATTELLVLRRSQAGELEAALAVSATAAKGLTPKLGADGKPTDLVAHIPAPDLKPWFRVTAVTREVTGPQYAGVQSAPTVEQMLVRNGRPVPGLYGYQVAVTVNTDIASWYGCGGGTRGGAACAPAVNDTTVLNTPDLVYVRPIPASVKLWPKPQPCAADVDCPADDKWTAAKPASGAAEVKLPQLSRLFRVPTHGSIFGSRTVAAEFGELGEPTMIQYAIGSASKDVAGVVDAGVSGAQTMRDADIAATKRKLDELKNSRDLEKLLEEMAAAVE